MLKKINENAIAKNIFLVASGTAGAQIIAVASMPIITRMYGPEAFGILGMFNAIVAVLGPIMALGYAAAIVLPKSDGEAKCIAAISYLLVLGMTAVIALSVLVINLFDIGGLSNGEMWWVLLATPLAAYLYGWQNISRYFATRVRKFRYISGGNFISAGLGQLVQIIMAFVVPISMFLILGQLLSIGIKALIFHLATRGDARWRGWGWRYFRGRKKRLGFISNKYSDFPKYRAPQILFNAATLSLPALMLGMFFSAAAVGFYSLARTVLGLPISLVGQAVQDVIYPYFNDFNGKSNSNGFFKAYCYSVLGLALIGGVGFLPIVFWGQELFGFVFGVEWAEAGVYAAVLVPWLWLMLATRPSIAALPVLHLQKWFLWFDVAGTLFKVIGLFFGFFFFNSALLAVGLFSLIGALMYVGLLGFVGCKIRQA
ncbi:lipopolysaccharide biosynthesis protein [Kerstersia gyiorum]|uniref:lipopolysaccharide biosynthesis protein n=1 Tax=Kerstersia gyiorum TaxID=206506 RepID=UPI0030CBB517